MPEYGGKEKRAYLWPQGLLMVGLCSPYKLFPFVVFWKEEAPTALGSYRNIGKRTERGGRKRKAGEPFNGRSEVRSSCFPLLGRWLHQPGFN
jgi:hypothetical protein